MSLAKIFEFERGERVSSIEKDGEPWFIVNDFCHILGRQTSSQLVRGLSDDEKGVLAVDTLGGTQSVNVVSEAGLNTIILRSPNAFRRGTFAYKFRVWVTKEVLPQIRKTGKYAPTEVNPGLPETLFNYDTRSTRTIVHPGEDEPNIWGDKTGFPFSETEIAFFRRLMVGGPDTPVSPPWQWGEYSGRTYRDFYESCELDRRLWSSRRVDKPTLPPPSKLPPPDFVQKECETYLRIKQHNMQRIAG